MFKFEESYVLIFLLLVPLILLGFYISVVLKRKRLNKLGDQKIISRLFPEWSVRKEWIKTGLLALSIGMAVIAYANPQWGTRKQKVKAKSSDIIIALDISQSMMAEDLSPNRMEKAKRFTSQLIKQLKGERIGLIFFAGSAYLQMPLTNDYAAADLFIKSANPKQAGTQGTAIAEAIDLAQSIFGDESPHQKALVLITDGENHDSEAIDAAEKAGNNGTFVFAVGVGTQDGAMVPFLDNSGRTAYKKDKSGNPVKSNLNVPLLQDISDASNGNFYLLNDEFALVRKLSSDLDKIEKQEVEHRSFTDYNSYFQYFLFFALIFLLWEYFLSNKKSKAIDFKKLLNI